MFDTQNKKIIRKLSNRSLTANKGRNIVTTFAIVLTTLVLTAIFSIGISYYDSYQAQKLQATGMDIDGEINCPNENQVELAKRIEEIKYAGLQIKCGKTMFYAEDTLVRFVMTWRDTINWEKQSVPAFEYFKGSYPIKEDEIVMSEWALEECGIKKYEIGMKIPLTYNTLKGEFQKEFTLTGVYADYSDVLSSGSSGIVLVSEHFMKNSGYSQTDIGSGKLYISFDNPFITDEKVKEIGDIIKLDDKQILYTDNDRFDILIGTGIGIALLSILIMICGYLLIYNILNISISSDIRFYGLLKTTGVTGRQIKKIIWQQVNILSLIGIPIGLMLGGAISFLIVPYIIRAMNDYLVIQQVSFHPVIFLGSALFAYLTTAIGSMNSARKAGNIEPLEALNFTDKKKYKSRKRSKSKNKLLFMAIGNILLNKKRTALVLASLFISITVFLSTHVIVQGNDIYKFIELYRKYEVSLSNETGMSEEFQAEQKFDSEFMAQLAGLSGVKSLETVSSEPMVIKYENDMFDDYLKEFYDLYMNESYEQGKELITEDPLTFQAQFVGISEEIFDDINLSMEKPIDKEKFMSGEICIIQSNQISLQNLADKEITISFPDLEDSNDYTLMIGGWARDNISRYAGIAPNIIVSDKAAVNYLKEPWIEQIEIISKKSFDRNLHNAINELVKDDSEIGFSSKIQVYDSMNSSNTVLTVFGGGISVILIIIGLLNFTNVLITSIFQRRKELACFESIGMTQRQIKQMLIYESGMYGLLTLLSVLSIGSAISYIVFHFIREEHMIFNYPYLNMTIVFIIIFIVCIITPLIILKKLEKKSLAEKLKKYN